MLVAVRNLAGGDEGGRDILGFQFDAVEGGVGDLEDADRVAERSRSRKLASWLLPRRGGGHVQAEVLGGDGLRLFGGDGRHRKLSGMEEVEQRHDR